MSDRIGAFDDTIRDAIKGSTGGTDGAFVQEGSRRANLKTGIAGQSDTTTGWANVPSQCVTYASCHDNLIAENCGFAVHLDMTAENKLLGLSP